MSYDITFLSPLKPGQTWEDVLERFEEGVYDDCPDLSEDPTLWSHIKGAVGPLLTDGEVFEIEDVKELTEPATGIQVGLYEDELSLSVPYWFAGDDAERVVEKMRIVAQAIERVSGLVAFDSQVEAPFLGDGGEQASELMSGMRQMIATEIAPADTQKQRPWWAFWC